MGNIIGPLSQALVELRNTGRTTTARNTWRDHSGKAWSALTRNQKAVAQACRLLDRSRAPKLDDVHRSIEWYSREAYTSRGIMAEETCSSTYSDDHEFAAICSIEYARDQGHPELIDAVSDWILGDVAVSVATWDKRARLTRRAGARSKANGLGPSSFAAAVLKLGRIKPGDWYRWDKSSARAALVAEVLVDIIDEHDRRALETLAMRRGPIVSPQAFLILREIRLHSELTLVLYEGGDFWNGFVGAGGLVSYDHPRIACSVIGNRVHWLEPPEHDAYIGGGVWHAFVGRGKVHTSMGAGEGPWLYFEQAGPNKPRHDRTLSDSIPIPTSRPLWEIVIGPQGGTVRDLRGNEPIDHPPHLVDPPPVAPPPEEPREIDWGFVAAHSERQLAMAVERDEGEVRRHHAAVGRLLGRES